MSKLAAELKKLKSKSLYLGFVNRPLDLFVKNYSQKHLVFKMKNGLKYTCTWYHLNAQLKLKWEFFNLKYLIMVYLPMVGYIKSK